MAIQIDYLAVSLLDNFKCDLEVIPLSSNLSIIRLDKLSDPKAQYIFGEEAISLSKNLATDPAFENHFVHYKFEFVNTVYRPIGLTNHTLCWRFVGEVPDPLDKNFDNRASAKSFSNTLTALRLLKPGFVGRYPTYIIGDPSVSTVAGGFVIASPVEDVEYLSPFSFSVSQNYNLESSDIEELTRILLAICNSSNVSLRVAISRLNRQYTRSRMEDKLIDAIVAFEAIYLSGMNDELKFRLAIRAGTHLGHNDKVERTRIFELVTKAYDLRSSIVHGSLHEISDSKIFKQGPWKRPDELLDDLTDLLRNSLRSILLEVGEKRFGSQFHKELDNGIVQGVTFER